MSHLCSCLRLICRMVLVQSHTPLMSRWDSSRNSTPPEGCHTVTFKFSVIWIVSLFLYAIHFLYLFGLTCSSSVATSLVGQTCIISSIPNFINSPGMSYLEMSLSYLVLIPQDSNMNPVATVGGIFFPLSCILFAFLFPCILEPWFFRSIFASGTLYIRAPSSSLI